MGVDGNVRDLYSRVLWGARVSLRVGFYVVIFALLDWHLIGCDIRICRRADGQYLNAIDGYRTGFSIAYSRHCHQCSFIAGRR